LKDFWKAKELSETLRDVGVWLWFSYMESWL